VQSTRGVSLDDHEITIFVRSLLPASKANHHAYFRSADDTASGKSCFVGAVEMTAAWSNKAIDEVLIRFEPVRHFKCAKNGGGNREFEGTDSQRRGWSSCIVSSANQGRRSFLRNANTLTLSAPALPSRFGFGPHMCIGKFVGQTEITVPDAVLDMPANIRLDPSKAGTANYRCNKLRGPHQPCMFIWELINVLPPKFSQSA